MKDTEATKDEDIPRRKSGRLSLARKVGKAYVDRAERKRQEQEVSPLLLMDALSGKGRYFLRLEERGAGTLLVNGATVVHLNPMAVEYLRSMFEGMDNNGIVRNITKRYKVSSSIARDDLDTLVEDLKRLEAGELPMRGSRVDPLSGPYFAPFRADIAITYRTGQTASAEDKGELDTEGWLKAIDRLWTFGIPHVCFTGGEPTLRDDLVEMVDHARSLGMMVGVLTDGERLGNKAFLGRLVDAGLTYVQISLASHDEVVHSKVLGTTAHARTVKAISNAIKAGLHVLANVLITKESEYGLEDTVAFLVGLGVKHITVNPLEVEEESSIPDWMLEKALERARKAAKGKARIFWFGPVAGKDPRSVDEVAAVGDLALGNLEWGAAKTQVFIHPDGTVMAGKAHGTVLGNIRTHGWNMLWYHSAMKEIRSKNLEQRRWKALQEQGFNGYPLFPGLKPRPNDG